MSVLKIKKNDGKWQDVATAEMHTHTVSDISDLPASIVNDVEALKDKVGADSVAYQINTALETMGEYHYEHPLTHPADMITGLSNVAISGDYNDLINKPESLGGGNEYVHPETHPASMIEGLSEVATSGSYSDLSDKPIIPSIAGLATITYVDEKFASVNTGGSGTGDSSGSVVMTEQVQADWIQTDSTQVDYIKHRPFGEELLELVPLTNLNNFIMSQYGVYMDDSTTVKFDFIVGNTYTIFWDDVKYECIAQDVSAILPNSVAIGNTSAFGFSGNNEPFIVVTNNGYLGCISLTDTQSGASHSIKLIQNELVTKQIDPKYIPIPYFGDKSKSEELFSMKNASFSISNGIGSASKYVLALTLTPKLKEIFNGDWTTLEIELDGSKYICKPEISPEGIKYAGNGDCLNGINNDVMPFAVYANENYLCVITTKNINNLLFTNVDLTFDSTGICHGNIDEPLLIESNFYYNVRFSTESTQKLLATTYTSNGDKYIGLGNPSLLGLGDSNSYNYFVYTKTSSDGTQSSGIVTTYKNDNPEIMVSQYASNSIHLDISITANFNDVTQIDPKYIPIPYFGEYEGLKDIVPTKQYELSELHSVYGVYYYNEIMECPVNLGETYIVSWDGVDYECTVQEASALMTGAVALGNLTSFGLTGNNEPFVIAFVNGYIMLCSLTDTEEGKSHKVGIKQTGMIAKTIDPKYIPIPYFGEKTTEPITVLPMNNYTFEYSADNGGYVYLGSATQEQVSLWINNCTLANIVWDGVEYKCEPLDLTGIKIVGNLDVLTGSGDNGMPFIFAIIPAEQAGEDVDLIVIYSFYDDTSDTSQVFTHNVSVSTISTDITTIDPKYIKNVPWDSIADKPFYNIPAGTVILNEPSLDFNTLIMGSNAVLLDEINIIDGCTYNIVIDGVEYEGIAVYISAYGATVIECESDNDDEDFMIIKNFSGMNGIIGSPGIHSVTIVSNDFTKTIDPMFIPKIDGLPEITESDNGKTLLVSEGVWSVAEPPKGVPEVTTSDNGKFLRVVDGIWTAVSVENAEEVTF